MCPTLQYESYVRLATNFNKPLNEWDVSNVIDMVDMFYFANFNQDITIGMYPVTLNNNFDGCFVPQQTLYNDYNPNV